MKTYWNTNGSLNAIPEWQPNCWIQVTCPTEEDQQELEETYKIPDYFLSDIILMKVLKTSAVIIGSIIGAGFASGKEIFEYLPSNIIVKDIPQPILDIYAQINRNVRK